MNKPNQMKSYASECRRYCEGLDCMANMFSLIYTTCIIFSIAIGITLLGDWIKNELINYTVGATGLFLTILPLVFKNTIEKIGGYRELSLDFKNLEQDFIGKQSSIETLENLKRLRKKLSNHPINFISKHMAERRLKR